MHAPGPNTCEASASQFQAETGLIDPFEDGPDTPYWRTEYYRREDPKQLKYELGSHADSMAEHLSSYMAKKPEDAVRITSYMVITRNGHHVSDRQH